jgi:hypothetical protein
MTGGRYFPAQDTGGLLNACQEIDRMERRQIQSFTYLRYREISPLAGAAALFCCVLVLTLETTRWRRLP